jgi:mannose-1-phosphate guanylyltransferase
MDPSEVSIIKGDFGWSDVGAFDVLYDAQKSTVDASSNVVLGNHVGEETSECLIYGNDKKLIATIGLSDLVIVDQDDVLMICPKGKAEDVKKIVQKMKSKNITDCL